MATSKGEAEGTLWRRVAMGSIVAIGLYVVVSYVAVPIIVERLILRTLVEETGLTATVGEIRFNPFETRLAIEVFELPDVDGDVPLLSFDELVIDVRPFGFFGADVALDEVRLVGPRLSVRIDEDGELRLTQLFSDAEEGSETESIEDSEAKDPLIIDIRAIHLEAGEALFRDESLDEPFELTLVPMALEIHDFTTRLEETASFDLSLAIGDQTELKWTGEIGFVPMRSAGRLELSNLDLRTPWEYLSSRLQFEIREGRLAAAARYEVTFDSDLDLRISEGSLDLNDIVIADRRAENKAESVDENEELEGVIDLPSVEVRNIRSVVDASALVSLDVGQIALAGGRVGVALEEDGGIALVEMFQMLEEAALEDAPSAAEGRTPTESSSRIRIDEVAVREFALDFEDRSGPQPVEIGFSKLSLDVTDIDTEPASELKVELVANVAESGKLHLSGSVQLAPLKAQLAVEATDISLKELAPYARRRARIEVSSGRLSTKFDLEIADRDAQELEVSGAGRLQVDDLRIIESGGGEDLVRWKALRLEGVDFGSDRIQVKEVAMDDGLARFVLHADGGSNFQSVIVSEESEESKPVQTQGDGSSQQAIRVDVVRLDSVAVVLVDEAVEPIFSTRLAQLQGTIEGLDSQGKTRADVNLTGRVNDIAPLEIKGQIDPFDSAGSNDITISVSGASMRRFTPYSGRYVGYGIAGGDLELELEYHLENRNLKANNRFRLERFEFGDRVESEGSTSLPVPLALSLLRDSKGAIEIDLPILGNLDDPSFSLLGLIGDAFVNLITRVAKAPFAVIGDLVGFSAEDLSRVVFAARSERLSNTESIQIEKLVDVLSKKPDLQIEIRGRADPAIDRFGTESEKAVESGRELARARAATVRDSILADERVAADRVLLVDVEIGAFGSPDGVPTELSLIVR